MRFFKQFPLSILVGCSIVCLSLYPIPEMEVSKIPFIDKWAHFIMYGGLSGVIWLEYLKAHRHVRFIHASFPAIIIPLLVSGLMELAQAYCTVNRHGDWLDMAANAVGVCIGSLTGWFIIRPILRRLF